MYLYIRNNPSVYRNLHISNKIGGQINAAYRSNIGVTGFGIDLAKVEMESNRLGHRNRWMGTLFVEHRFSFLDNALDVTPGVSVGYFSDFDRNFAVNTATDAAHDAHHRLFDATEAALNICKPGIKACDLYEAMDAVLRPGKVENATTNGGDDVGRYGHGMGIQLTEPPSHTNWDTTVIEAGMTLTLEPSLIYDQGYLMVAEENVLVTETGYEMLSARCHRDLPVIG